MPFQCKLCRGVFEDREAHHGDVCDACGANIPLCVPEYDPCPFCLADPWEVED